jgi:hypothetical protein
MSLAVTCFYCGAKKEIELGTVAKLTCDVCSSPRVLLQQPATFKCMLCHQVFRLPAGRQVMAYHNRAECRGRSLVLIDVDD